MGAAPACDQGMATGKTLRKQAWDNHHGEHHLWSFPVLKPFEHRQVVPFGPGQELRVCRIRHGAQRRRVEEGQDAQDQS